MGVESTVDTHWVRGNEAHSQFDTRTRPITNSKQNEMEVGMSYTRLSPDALTAQTCAMGILHRAG